MESYNDRQHPDFIMPFEVSDGRLSRCGLCWMEQPRQPCGVLSDLRHELKVPPPQGCEPNVWWDKLLLAYVVYTQLPQELRMRAAATPTDPSDAPHGGAPMVSGHMPHSVVHP
jgi:hypothetical protein